MAELRIENFSAVMPVALQTFKNHLRKTDSAEDTLLQAYLAASVDQVERYLGRALINKNFVQSHDHFPGRRHGFGYGAYHRDSYASHGRNRQEIKLLRSPLRKVTKIVYIDTSGNYQTLVPQVIRPWSPQVQWFIGDQILDTNGNIQEVTAVAGHPDGSPNLSGSSAPTWPNNGPVTDADITWTFQKVAPTGDFRVYPGEPSRIVPLNDQVWPYTLPGTPNAVHIHFTAGYGLTGDYINPQWTQAILLTAANMYEFREPVSDLQLKEVPVLLRQMLEQDRIVDYSPTE